MEKTIQLTEKLVTAYTERLTNYEPMQMVYAYLDDTNTSNERVYFTDTPEPRRKLIASGTRGKVLHRYDTYKLANEKVFTLPAKGKGGRIVRSGRLFGAELELIRGGDTLRRHANRASGTQVKRDGSVNGESLELTTPPMSGSTAEYVFKNILAPATADASTDTSCGLHVHVDARDFKVLASKGKHEPFKRLTLTYLALQQFMFSLVPFSRRANSYCKAIDNVPAKYAQLKAMTAQQVYLYMLDRHANVSRYYWYNLVPFYREGHYEVRLHNGTRDTRKVLEWANMHTALADSAMHGWLTADDLDKLASGTMGTLHTLELLEKRLRLSSHSVEYWRGRYSKFNNA